MEINYTCKSSWFWLTFCKWVEWCKLKNIIYNSKRIALNNTILMIFVRPKKFMSFVITVFVVRQGLVNTRLLNLKRYNV